MKRVAVLALLVGALATATGATPATTRTPQLVAWAGPQRPLVGVSRIGFGRALVRRLAPGPYRIEVHTYPDYSFHLYGAGVDRRTQFGTGGAFVLTRWTVRLRRGVYRYRAEGIDAAQLAREGVPVGGSFVVR